MAHRNGALTLAALSLTALGLIAAPVCAFAQGGDANKADTTSNDQLNKPINLDVRSANLYYALTLLFDQLKIGNYSLPDSLKSFEVSAHFTSLPLRTALETLLKNSGYTYKVESGVWSVVPKTGEPAPPPIPDDSTPPDAQPKSKKIYRITGTQIIYNSVDIVTRLGGKVLPSSVGSGAARTGGAGGNGLGGLGGGLSGGLGGGIGGFGSGGLGSGFGGSLGGFGGNIGGLNGGVGNSGSGNFGSGMGSRGGRGF